MIQLHLNNKHHPWILFEDGTAILVESAEEPLVPRWLSLLTFLMWVAAIGLWFLATLQR